MSKSRKKVDTGQLDIFGLIKDISRKQAKATGAHPTIGKASIDATVRAIISDSLKRTPLSRYEAAGRMSGILGVEISKAQLDAWSAESKENHRFPVVYAPAFCQATEDYSLVRYVAELCGGYFIVGEEAIDFASGRIETQIKSLKKQLRVLDGLRKDGRHG